MLAVARLVKVHDHLFDSPGAFGAAMASICYHRGQFVAVPTILGNLLQEPFADLVGPERIREVVEAVPAYCAPCALRDTCAGPRAGLLRLADAQELFLYDSGASARPLAEDLEE